MGRELRSVAIVYIVGWKLAIVRLSVLFPKLLPGISILLPVTEITSSLVSS